MIVSILCYDDKNTSFKPLYYVLEKRKKMVIPDSNFNQIDTIRAYKQHHIICVISECIHGRERQSLIRLPNKSPFFEQIEIKTCASLLQLIDSTCRWTFVENLVFETGFSLFFFKFCWLEIIAQSRAHECPRCISGIFVRIRSFTMTVSAHLTSVLFCPKKRKKVK